MTDPKWFEKVDKNATPKKTRASVTYYRKMIRRMCLHCCGDQVLEVKECPANDCPLWPARLGKAKQSRGTLPTRKMDCLGNDPDLYPITPETIPQISMPKNTPRDT